VIGSLCIEPTNSIISKMSDNGSRSIEETFSPLPPPPPPQEQGSTFCIRKILDEYYDAGSFGSNSSSGVAHYMNAADSILDEMNRISPPKKIEGNSMKHPSHEDVYVSRSYSNQDDDDNMMNEECRWKEDTQQQNHHQVDLLQPNDIPLNSFQKLERGESVHDKSSKLIGMCKETELNNSTCKPTKSFQILASESLTVKSQTENKLTTSTFVEPNGHLPSPIPKVTDEQESVMKPKRSFLRKGTRKEPSALHRMSKSCSNNTQQNGSSSDSNEKRNSLEPLERMQEKQMEDLQKRINRRLEARDDIRKRKQGCKIQVEGQSKEDMKSALNEKIIATATPNESKLTDESFDSTSSDDSQSESDNSSEMSCQAEDKEVIRQKKVYSSPAPKNRSHSVSKSFKSNTTSKCPPKLKDETNEFFTSEIEEQWQLIKSMRRRQEAALRAAEKEREETKAWAAGEKEKLNKWKDHQRSLIQKERQRASNSMMINERKKRQEKLEEQVAEASQMSYRKVKEEIDSLKDLLKKQKIETDAAKSRHRLNEKRWKDMIAERDKQILSLNEEIQKISKVNDDLAQEKAHLVQKVEQMTKEKKKKKKKSIIEGEDCQDIQASSLKANATSQRNLTHDHYDNSRGKNDDYNTSHHESMPNTGKVTNERTKNDITTEAFTDKPSPHVSKSLNEECDKNRDNIENVKDLARIIASHKDLLVDPTEEWLRCHLDSIQCKSHESGCEDNGKIHASALDEAVSNYYTPLKERQYDPTKYAVTEEKNCSNNVTIQKKVKEEKLPNGTKIITFHNGTVKETLPDGTVIVRFTNGDIKTSYGNIGITVYFYSESKVCIANIDFCIVLAIFLFF
jgi:hypothetical protein